MLPCYEELARRHVVEQATCPMCGSKDESLFHSLIACDHAKCFWSSAQRSFSLKVPSLHPSSFAEDMLVREIIPRREAEIMITVMWAVWHSRNKYTHGEEKFQPLKSMEIIEDIVRSLELPAPARLIKPVVVANWVPDRKSVV